MEHTSPGKYEPEETALRPVQGNEQCSGVNGFCGGGLGLFHFFSSNKGISLYDQHDMYLRVCRDAFFLFWDCVSWKAKGNAGKTASRQDSKPVDVGLIIFREIILQVTTHSIMMRVRFNSTKFPRILELYSEQYFPHLGSSSRSTRAVTCRKYSIVQRGNHYRC